MSTESQRVVYLDLLRVVATFGVIVLHVFCTEYDTDQIPSYNWCIAVVGDSLVRWSVPVFVMISGALFLNPAKAITPKTILLKSIPRLLLAYVFWTLAYGCTMIIYEGASIRDLFSPYFHLWFLPMLMGIYTFIPLLRKIAEEKTLLKYALCLWLFYISFGFLTPILTPQIADILRQFTLINSIMGYSGYFLLGFYLSQIKLSKKQRIVIYFAGIIGAIITILGNLCLSIYVNRPTMRFFNNLSLHVAAMSIALFIFIRDLEPKLGVFTTRFIDYVRKDLFGIYLTHALWLMVLNNSVVRNLCNQLITLPLISIAIFFLSLYTTKLIRLIPGLKKVVE